ncbi:polyprenyl synthetase family protein [Novipirellula artificiosorum]|uniref:Farnesyl diphosphate synthase n=1 Tax=Novipirellula artificiosorum TaxID=2528016 RepID=A0A5C6DMD2_9BACT|nr:farnesyl diphosphate synthase [Novipirellula artificiosorum]TWU36076.1 Farnesyl diphosphate synthase [Novipirellula artificiosorum]
MFEPPSPFVARPAAVPLPQPAGTNPTGMEDFRPKVEQSLQQACDFGQGCPPRLAEAMRYALLAPGKRLRPGLVLMASETCGGTTEDAMPAAVAIEMIHAYSLVHDDLPAMDDDDLRRGRPTVHVKFDEPTAILVGDALQAQAFSHLLSHGLQRHPTDPSRVASAVQVLASAAGAGQLVGGQFDDLAAEREAATDSPNSQRIRTLSHLEAIHRRKTGALFSAALDLGAILAGANSQSRQALFDYSKDLGLAFQVVDDLLDFTSDEQSLGKRVGKDADRGKLTYPGLLGIEGARTKAKQLVESARKHVGVFGDAAWRLARLADYVLHRTH